MASNSAGQYLAKSNLVDKRWGKPHIVWDNYWEIFINSDKTSFACNLFFFLDILDIKVRCCALIGLMAIHYLNQDSGFCARLKVVNGQYMKKGNLISQ